MSGGLPGSGVRNAFAVIDAPGAVPADEVLEVRPRLRESKAAKRRRQGVGEEREGDRVGGLRLAVEGVGGLLEALCMVRDQLACPACRILEHLAVPGESQPRRESRNQLEGREIVAERVGAGIRIETDVGRDRSEQGVTGRENAVIKERDVPVGMARQMEHLPPVDLVTGVHELRLRDEPAELATAPRSLTRTL